MIDSPDWEPWEGSGGFSFLDAIGFRYYLAPAMIRCIRSGHDLGIRFFLTLPTDRLRQHTINKWSALDRRQRLCIARFLRYMIAACEGHDEPGHELEREWWQESLHSYWDTLR